MTNIYGAPNTRQECSADSYVGEMNKGMDRAEEREMECGVPVQDLGKIATGVPSKYMELKRHSFIF